VNFDGSTLAEATGGTLVRDAGAGPIWTDTRTLPEGAWFLAIRGDRFDGHAYVQAALDRGAAGAIVERVDPEWGAGVVRVSSSVGALQDLGRFARRRFVGPVVGLTGSSGKTTTRAFTALALSPLGQVHQTVGNLNNHLGVPMTLVAAPMDAAAMVVEMGTSSPGEIQLLAELTEPDIRVIVNIGPAHLEELGGLSGVAMEKGSLYRSAQPGDTVVVNDDDPFTRSMEIPDGVRRITVGTGPECDIRVLNMRPSAASLKTRVLFGTPEGLTGVVLPVFGPHFGIDAALALGVAWAAGADLREATAALGRYEPVGMRMRVENLPGGVRVFNDAYNANPASMSASLDAFAEISGRKVAVLGDMLELGPDEDRYHSEIVGHADALGLDLIVLIGERMGRAASAAERTETWPHIERTEAGARLSAWLQHGDQMLVKGSRGAHTEEVPKTIRRLREGE